MVRVIHDTRVSSVIPDGLNNVHAANQDAPLAKRKNTDGDGHPSSPFPESNAMEGQQFMLEGQCRRPTS